ncbi:Glycosyltransferase involved in cell wall bisynthesis [Modicisalibacter ilicicola DSM 19980]|uniref:Glycosyltransferase involved in cell wall bisynthesis n=1 Tax=Modicisalibacter ilicicola DSM 19980 TaxID=1121942 RepID=A0A1M5EMU0_9GAMM|nr:glycosyltransferase family 4 protein [Halomonas ilicicola]SHF80603.1 Glycosyltransferase involved in cell wall bisynthesis [Halomonas ilicicola DSM 19980]
MVTSSGTRSGGLTGPRVGHLVSLKNLGGIERSFSQFFERYANEYDHHVLKQTDDVHPFLEAKISFCEPERIHGIKGPRGIKIPRILDGLRERYQRKLLRDLGIEAILVWGKIVNHPLVFPERMPVVHYERGSAWLVEEQSALRHYLDRLDGLVCNSYAAHRFLQLKWGVSSELPSRVIYNTTRLPQHHSTHLAGRFRLGFAGRLIALKAPMVALEAFAELKAACPYAELWIAGEGPQEVVLRRYVERWGLQGSVRFCGLVDDMSAFYSELDAFICPSWREPFGNVAQEALAHGLPTLVGNVDGLAEQVTHGENGVVLPPKRQRSELGRYGKECLHGPDEVYSPDRDAIVQAGIMEPCEIAVVLKEWAESPELRARMGRNARARVERDFNLDNYGHELVDFMASIVAKNHY